MPGVVADGTSMGSATRTDRLLGIEERFEFFGVGRQRLAGSIHAPMGSRIASLLICPSICNDYMRNFRNEILIARGLAASGVVVGRFDYRGTGNSDGDSMEMTFGSMCEDATRSAEWLRAAAPDLPVMAVMGTRFGALVAASVTDEMDADPIVWVDPTIEGSRFFREGWRARRARDTKDGSSTDEASMLDLLETHPAVDVLGHSVGRRLVQSAAGRTLTGEIGTKARRLLWMQLGGRGDLQPAARAAVSELAGRGLTIDTRQIGIREPWWFQVDEESPAREHLPVIEGWLLDQLASMNG